MTPSMHQHKPLEPTRMRQESPPRAGLSHHALTQDLRGVTRDESEHFEQLLAPLDIQGQIIVADFSEGLSNSHPQDQEQRSAASLPGPQTSALWEAVLAHLEEQFGPLDKGPVEAHLELPTLGQIAVRMTQYGDTLDIALRFAQDDAWQRCAAHKLASTTWLSQKLGRPVRLSLLREAH